ncbi:MAG: hypothetical protein P1S60_19780, partial [Anaerolineae bacterium]|nr:hypothetical protein [Anaerolineae bacterium]
PVAFQLADAMPNVGFMGGDLFIHSGDAAGQKMAVRAIEDDLIILGMANPRMLYQVKPGDKVQVDNSNFLAAQTYHRHQVPGEDYPVWDQFCDADGKPVYPQRPLLMGPMLTANTCGAPMSGKFKGKIIIVESLWDREAFPWQADWYRSKVKENLGDSIDDQFRLWFVDRAVHGDINLQEDPTRVVSYLGVLHQALRDLSAWVEEGLAPPASTSYQVADGQVIVPPGAAERKGIQPVIMLTVNYSACAVSDVGQQVHFTAVIDVPPQAGPVVATAWDFEGEGSFPVVEQLRTPETGEVGDRMTLKRTYTFTKPGTYFPVLRAVTQRQGDAETPYARIRNLGRVRVVVK